MEIFDMERFDKFLLISWSARMLKACYPIYKIFIHFLFNSNELYSLEQHIYGIQFTQRQQKWYYNK